MIHDIGGKVEIVTAEPEMGNAPPNAETGSQTRHKAALWRRRLAAIRAGALHYTRVLAVRTASRE